MQTKNAINKVTKKGYEITEEKGLYTFVIDGRDYSFMDQDGKAILFSTHFKEAIHPEYFKNLTQLLKFAETDYSETKEIEEKEIKEVTEVPEITEVIENSTHPEVIDKTEENKESNAIVIPANKSSFKKTIIRPYVSPDIECVELILCDDGTPDYLLEVTKHLGHSIDFKVYSVTSCDPSSGLAIEFSLYLKGSVQWDGGCHFWFGEEDSITGRANGYLSLGNLEQYENHFNLMRNIYLYASEMIGESEYFTK